VSESSKMHLKCRTMRTRKVILDPTVSSWRWKLKPHDDRKGEAIMTGQY